MRSVIVRLSVAMPPPLAPDDLWSHGGSGSVCDP